MLEPLLFAGAQQPRHILCLGAHCDDIEIGCGGTLLRLLQHNPQLTVTWVVFASNAQRRAEATQGAQRFCTNAARLDLRIFEFRDGFLPYAGAQVKDCFEQIKHDIQPDLIFTHFRHDLHQDHRVVNELTWNTFRNHFILEYEIPKWDGDLGVPNTFVTLDEALVQHKIQLLNDIYRSQQGKNWFSDDLFWSLPRIRGMECNSPSRLAEAFYVRKLRLSF
jgi:LmbE family N-acetylglucosaminyl deacetylase